MTSEKTADFGPFCFDLDSRRLWRDQVRVSLGPTLAALLVHLIEHRHRVVSRQELLDSVWSDVHVSEKTPKARIRDLRRILEDDLRAPRYIATVHHPPGYRFIAQIRHPEPAGPPLVGRTAELQHLRRCLDQAHRGSSLRLVLVTGETGIGKTTLIEHFLTQVQGLPDLLVGRGQCCGTCRPGDADQPLLDALSHLCKQLGESFVDHLRRHAPSWLGSLPAFAESADSKSAPAFTRARKLRELAEALETLTAERSLLLVLEDLHLSDASSLEALTFLARRRQPARLLVIATYRPSDLGAEQRRFAQLLPELEVKGRCKTLPLPMLDEAQVAEYLSRRFPQHRLPSVLAHLLHHRSGGNPLFVNNLLDLLVNQRRLLESDQGWELRAEPEEVRTLLPEDLRRLIDARIEMLRPEQREILEVAGVAGVDFAVPTVAAAFPEDPEAEETVESACQALTRQEIFLTPRTPVAWPDATRGEVYGFIHALYRDVLYERVKTARRRRLRHQIGPVLARDGCRRAKLGG